MPPKSGRVSRHRPQGLIIVHEDRDILVVDKAPGLLTIGTEHERERTAYHRLTDYVRKGAAKSPARVFIVHRLDRDASGLLVFARSQAVKERMQADWETYAKTYVAVVEGGPARDEGAVVSRLVEGAGFRVRSTRDPAQGREARTAYRVLRRGNGRALIEIDLLTGRKHQIRVHLSEMGAPIVGDAKYGPPKRPKQRLALHALAIAFPHPATGAPLEFRTPVPPHFLRLLGDARKPGGAA